MPGRLRHECQPALFFASTPRQRQGFNPLASGREMWDSESKDRISPLANGREMQDSTKVHQVVLRYTKMRVYPIANGRKM